MADFYVWTKEELGLDVPDMDREHQTLIAKMNALYDAIENKQPNDQVQKFVDDLAAYTTQHFADEEAYMESVQFPGLATHKIIHGQLLKQFSEHMEEYKKTQTLGKSFFNFLKVWLTGHIRGIDRKYSEHTHKKKAA